MSSFIEGCLSREMDGEANTMSTHLNSLRRCSVGVFGCGGAGTPLMVDFRICVFPSLKVVFLLG